MRAENSGSGQGSDARSAAKRSGRVDATPASVAPGEIPACRLRRSERYVVDARRAEGIAAQEARERHPAACPQTEPLDRLVTIDGAGRQVPAVKADKWRQRVPVQPDQRAAESARKPKRVREGIGTMLAVWMLHVRFAAIVGEVLRGSSAGNSKLLFARHILHVFWEQCSKYLWTICIPTDTIFVTSMCRFPGRRTGLA